MKPLILLAFVIALTACNQAKKENSNESNPVDTTGVPPADTNITAPPTTTGKIDIESFGDIKIGQLTIETVKVLGEPENKTKPEEWGADGLMHEYWNWKGKGLEVNMAAEKNNPATMKVFSINAESPNTFKTKAGIGVGSTYNEIKAAYAKDISEADSNTEQVLVGSVYGGIIFTLTNGKVSHVFLGAAAE